MDVCAAAACDNAFFNCCLRSCESVFHTELLLFHLGLGCCADPDYCYAACEFSKSFLKFLFVVLGCGVLKLSLDNADTSVDIFL